MDLAPRTLEHPRAPTAQQCLFARLFVCFDALQIGTESRCAACVHSDDARAVK